MKDELGETLRAWRARVSPEDVGLPTYGERRRVTGLRREELAMLAGVSASYYARLEQGQSRNASAEVLGAIADALRLSEAERQHLTVLNSGQRRRAGTKRPPVEHADPALADLLGVIGDVPALILGRRSDVLAWNPMGHALLAGDLPLEAPATPATRPNMAELIFTDPHNQELYACWPAKARAVVGNLRLVAGQHPDDPVLASLVGNLSMTSPEFAKLWGDHRIQPCATADYELRHPLVGPLTVTQQSLRALQAPDQILVTCTAAQNSSSAAALTLLAQLVHPPTAPSAGEIRLSSKSEG